MVTVEASLVAPGKSAIGPELRLHDSKFVPDLARLVAAVKAEGAAVGIQLWHPGRQTNLSEPVAPSPVPLSPRTRIPRELTKANIEELVEHYGSAAARCREAGFDYVEVHAARCYLPCEFLSPLVNLRRDEYGGELANRARFLLDIVRSVRASCGDDYPVFCRITGTDGLDGGSGIEDAVQVARWLVEAGVSCLSVSAGTWHTLHLSIPPMFMDRGCLVPLAERIKAAVDVPVIAAGRLDEPSLAEQVLSAGQADLISLGRALVAYPDWATKVRNGRYDEVTPCIACNACLELISSGAEMRCAVNPEAARELQWRADTVPVAKRRVMVVGSGPSGLEAARVARLRGHAVSIWEREDLLGGKLDVASRAPSKHEVLKFRERQEKLLKSLGVDVHLGVEVDARIVDAEEPDVVIVAIGARPLIPSIAGADSPHVIDAQRVLLGQEDIHEGVRVAVIGGSATGCETAETLAHAGCEVTIVEMPRSAGRGIEFVTRRRLLERLREVGVAILTGSKVVSIQPDRLVYEAGDGTTGEVECDLVALAIGWVPRGDEFVAALNGRRHLVVGDASRPADFLAAVNAGADAARSV